MKLRLRAKSSDTDEHLALMKNVEVHFCGVRRLNKILFVLEKIEIFTMVT